MVAIAKHVWRPMYTNQKHPSIYIELYYSCENSQVDLIGTVRGIWVTVATICKRLRFSVRKLRTPMVAPAVPVPASAIREDVQYCIDLMQPYVYVYMYTSLSLYAYIYIWKYDIGMDVHLCPRGGPFLGPGHDRVPCRRALKG